jgi:anti-anti-sigma factor
MGSVDGTGGTMAVTVRRANGDRSIVVAVTGALDSAAAPALRRALAEALRAGRPILVDLVEVTSVDRAGVVALVAAQRQARRAGRPLLVRTGTRQIRRLLAVLGMLPDDLPPGDPPR